MFSKRNVIAALAVIVVIGAGLLYQKSNDAWPFELPEDPADAARFTNEATLRKAFAGNTINYAGKGRGGTTTIFYAPNGNMLATTATVSVPLEGTWRTRGRYHFCQQYNGRNESCNKVLVEGENAKFHNDDGKLQFEAKIVPGNQVKMPEPRKR
jgi:hypothetical protein